MEIAATAGERAGEHGGGGAAGGGGSGGKTSSYELLVAALVSAARASGYTYTTTAGKTGETTVSFRRVRTAPRLVVDVLTEHADPKHFYRLNSYAQKLPEPLNPMLTTDGLVTTPTGNPPSSLMDCFMDVEVLQLLPGLAAVQITVYNNGGKEDHYVNTVLAVPLEKGPLAPELAALLAEKEMTPEDIRSILRTHPSLPLWSPEKRAEKMEKLHEVLGLVDIPICGGATTVQKLAMRVQGFADIMDSSIPILIGGLVAALTCAPS